MSNMANKGLPEVNKTWILIWGASCVTGMMTVQLAKLSGLRVFAIAGPHNAAKLHGLGADKVVDRHRPDAAIAEARKLPIRLGIDCVGQETATYAIRALQPRSKLAYLVKRPVEAAVQETGAEVRDVLIKRFHEDEAYGHSVVSLISRHLFSRALQPVEHEVVGGLKAIESGLQRLKSQDVSGRKLVVVAE